MHLHFYNTNILLSLTRTCVHTKNLAEKAKLKTKLYLNLWYDAEHPVSKSYKHAYLFKEIGKTNLYKRSDSKAVTRSQ